VNYKEKKYAYILGTMYMYKSAWSKNFEVYLRKTPLKQTKE
jgi:hypothetical protein